MFNANKNICGRRLKTNYLVINYKSFKAVSK